MFLIPKVSILSEQIFFFSAENQLGTERVKINAHTKEEEEEEKRNLMGHKWIYQFC